MSIALNGDGIISGVSSITVGAGASVFSPAANTLALGTNGSERVRVDSSGNVGVGTDNPTVFGTAYRTVQLNPASGTGDGSAIRFMYDGGTANTNDLVIYTNSAQSYIRANGDRNIDVMRNGSTVATFNANGIALPSGGGIDFSATADSSGTMTSELLDDYEEGTWTPTMDARSSNFSSVTYSTRVGTYTKIGNIVTITAYIGVSSWSGGSGEIRVAGIPFDVTGGANPGYVFNVYTNGMSAHAVNGISFNTTLIEFYKYVTAGGFSNLLDTDLTQDFFIRFTGSYRTDS